MWLCVAVRRVYGCCFLFHLVSVTLLSNVPQFNWQTASGFFHSLFTFLYCIRVALPANILLRIVRFAFLWENLQCKHTDLCLRMDKMCEWKLAHKLKHISTTNSWVRWERERKKIWNGKLSYCSEAKYKSEREHHPLCKFDVLFCCGFWTGWICVH